MTTLITAAKETNLSPADDQNCQPKIFAKSSGKSSSERYFILSIFFWRYEINLPKLKRPCEQNTTPNSMNIFLRVQTLTTRDCKGPQTNMPKNVGSINMSTFF